LIEQFDPNPQPGTTISKASLEPARKGLGLAEVNAKLYAFVDAILIRKIGIIPYILTRYRSMTL